MSRPPLTLTAIALLGGLGFTATGLWGQFDTQVHYCDHHTTPCTPMIVAADFPLPRTATVIETIHGMGTKRTLGAIAAFISFGFGMALTTKAEKQEQQRKLKAQKLEAEQVKHDQILEKEEEAKLLIAANMRVALFDREIKEASALLYLEQHPELVELLAQQPTPTEPPAKEIEEDDEDADDSEQNQPSPTKKQRLAQLIQKHEGGWIGQLMKKPVLIYGDMGAFKSYFAAFLALTRHYLYDHKIVSISDPHFHQNKQLAWKFLIKLGVVGYGAHLDYAEVNNALELMYERFKVRTQKDQWVTSLWDELTNYSLYDECKSNAALFLRKILSDPRKAHEAPILIAHDNTLKALAGSEGFGRAKDRALIKLELLSDSELTPLFKGKISGIKNDQGERIDNMNVSIKPDWIRPEFVYNLFNPSANPVTELPLDQQQQEVTFREQLNQFLGDCWELNTPGTSPKKGGDSSPAVPGSPRQVPDRSPRPSKDYSDSPGTAMTAKKVRELFPDTTPESLFESLKTAAAEGKSPSWIIKKVLKCNKDDSDKKRSYNLVGKPVLKWLVKNYGTAAINEQFKDFFEQEQEEA